MPLPSPEENRGQLQPMRKVSMFIPAWFAHRTRCASIFVRQLLGALHGDDAKGRHTVFGTEKKTEPIVP